MITPIPNTPYWYIITDKGFIYPDKTVREALAVSGLFTSQYKALLTLDHPITPKHRETQHTQIFYLPTANAWYVMIGDDYLTPEGIITDTLTGYFPSIKEAEQAVYQYEQ